MKLPFMKWFPSDWIQDTRQLSACARGVWIDIINFAWIASPRGVYERTPEQMAREIGIKRDEIDPLLAELATVSDIEKTDQLIRICCRRLIKEEHERQGSTIRQRRLRERGGGDPEKWAAIRVAILVRDNYTCGYCGRKATTVDHITPQSLGGSNADPNLIACCKSCNMRKGIHTVEQAGMSFWRSQSRLHNTSVTPYIPDSKTLEARSQMSEESQHPFAAQAPQPVPEKAARKPKAKRPPIPFWKELVKHVDVTWMKKKGAPYPWSTHEYAKLSDLARVYQAHGVMAIWDLYLSLETFWGKTTRFMIDGLKKDIGVIVDDPRWKLMAKQHEDNLLAANGDSIKSAGEVLNAVGLAPKKL